MQTQLVGPASGTRGRAEALTDLYIAEGDIGRVSLSSACYTWHDTLRLVATELWKRGEAERARVMLKAGRVTVRQFLRERFGIVTGAREYWHRENWTPDRADLQEFLRALRHSTT
jgi:hypothetical protein